MTTTRRWRGRSSGGWIWSSSRWSSSTRWIAAKCAPWAHEIELLQTIPGVGEKVAQVIVAETGADMSRFPSAAHLAAWAGVAPGIHESAGKRTPTSKRHGNKWLTAMLVEAAGSVARMHQSNYLSAQHARIAKRRGTGRAQVAVAHSILVSAWHMLTKDEPYQDLGADCSRGVTTRPTRAGWSRSSNDSGTPCNSIPSPNSRRPSRRVGLRPTR